MFSIMKYTDKDVNNNTRITLKAARINAGLTQEQAAEAFGVSRAYVNSWENNPGEIKLKYLVKIEEVYGYPLNNINFCS